MSSREEPFTWFELQTVDVDDAIDFYTSVLPWDVSVWSDDD